MDFEDRNRAEEELRRSEAKHRLVLETASDAVISIDERGAIVLANPATMAVFGHDPAELIGKPLTVLMPEYMAKLHEAGFSRYQETGKKHLNWRGTEVVALRADGQSFPAEVSFGEMSWNGQRAFTGFIRDISEKKRAQEAMLASERNLRSIIDTIPTLAWSSKADGRVDFLNRRWLEFTGLSAEEAHGFAWTVAIHPDDANGVLKHWEAALVSGMQVDFEARMRRFDGVYRWFFFRAGPLRDESGKIVKWYGTNIDIEDRKQADEALRNMQARLAQAMQVATGGELSASIAHEINQPLAAVVASGNACLRFLSAQPPNLIGAREAAESIVRDGKDAGEIVRRIRALFKRAAVEKSMINVNDVIGEVLQLLADEIARQGVTVETDLWQDSPLIPGDRVQLQQLILNLLLNGMEAMDSVRDRPRKLWIRSAPESPGQVQVEVRDNGVGLKDPDKIFEAFFTTKENGMGMGLAICRSIVEAHGGQLWVAAREGPGANFCFTVPLKESAES